MKQILTVFSYTFKEGIRKKAFWISTIVIMVLLGVMCAIPRVMSFFDNGEEGTDTKTEYSGTCYLVDETGVFEKEIEYLKAAYPGMNFKSIEQDEVKGLEKAVDESKSRNVAILSIQEKDAAPVLEITVSNFLSKIQADTITDACNKVWQSHLLTENGLEKGEVDAIQTPLTYTQRFIGNMNLTEYVVGLLLTFVMFFCRILLWLWCSNVHFLRKDIQSYGNLDYFSQAFQNLDWKMSGYGCFRTSSAGRADGVCCILLQIYPSGGLSDCRCGFSCFRLYTENTGVPDYLFYFGICSLCSYEFCMRRCREQNGGFKLSYDAGEYSCDYRILSGIFYFCYGRGKRNAFQAGCLSADFFTLCSTV